MNKKRFCMVGLMVCIFFTACAEPAAEVPGVAYGQIDGSFSGMTPAVAEAYLSVVDMYSGHLGYEEAEASEGEFLHGGFICDWDNDGTPELCLLLKTSPREPDSWDGTPVYGWYPPSLYLYTYRDGGAVRAGECDLYFATGGREAVIAALLTGGALQYVRWEHSAFENVTCIDCFELLSGSLQKKEVPAEAAAASESAETARAFLDAIGNDKVQLLLYNNSGEAGIEGEANARELRAALAAAAKDQ